MVITSEPRLKKDCFQKSCIKATLITFFDSRGIIHKKFVPEGRTVNSKYYLEILKRLLARIKQMKPDLGHFP